MNKPENSQAISVESLDDNWASAKRNRDAVLAMIAINSPDLRHTVEREIVRCFNLREEELPLAYNALSRMGKTVKRPGEGYVPTHFATPDMQTETYQAMKGFVDGIVERHEEDVRLVNESAATIWQMYLRPGSN